jgi:hypothetical protein
MDWTCRVSRLCRPVMPCPRRWIEANRSNDDLNDSDDRPMLYQHLIVLDGVTFLPC